MSRHAMTWALDNATVTGQTQILLLALADRCHDGSAVCWPGYEDMMRRLKVGTKRAVDAHLDKLREAGEIVSEKRFHKESGTRRKVYRLLRYENFLIADDPNNTFRSSLQSPEQSVPNDPNVSCQSPEQSVPNDPNVSCSTIGTLVNEVNGEEQEPPPVELPKGFPKTEQQAVQWALGAMPEAQVIDLWRRCYAVGGRIPWIKNLPPIANWRSFIAAEASRQRTIPLPANGYSKNGAPPLSGNLKPADKPINLSDLDSLL